MRVLRRNCVRSAPGTGSPDGGERCRRRPRGGRHFRIYLGAVTQNILICHVAATKLRSDADVPNGGSALGRESEELRQDTARHVA